MFNYAENISFETQYRTSLRIINLCKIQEYAVNKPPEWTNRVANHDWWEFLFKKVCKLKSELCEIVYWQCWIF